MIYPSWQATPIWIARPELNFTLSRWLDIQPHDVIRWSVNDVVCECIVVDVKITDDIVRGKLMVSENKFVYFRCPLNRLAEVASAERTDS